MLRASNLSRIAPAERPFIQRNYRQAKRQKEEARKLRNQQKQERRAERTTVPDDAVATPELEQDIAPAAPPKPDV